MKKPLATLLAIFLIGSFALINFHVSSAAVPIAQKLIEPPVLYVIPGGISTVCSSWDAACDLQTALSIASSGDQVWVAAGTYKPTDTADRFATFQLESGVSIYGGFPALGGTWEQRDWVNNLTTLSGDIGTIGDSSDNSYHVVSGNGVDGTAILDGFTISGGNANGDYPHYYGGGMYNSSSSPKLTNIIFSTNSATYHGGGMFNDSSNPTLTNVTFSENSATNYGGGMYNYSSSPTLTNVTFSDNSAYYGGGMFSETSSNPTLNNAIFSDNEANSGGGMYNQSSSSPTVTNVAFSGNLATFGGGMYNTYSHPILTNVTFSANLTDYGGGICNFYSSPTLTNITFSGNSASTNGSGMYNINSSPTLTKVTFSANSAYYGGGMYNINSSPLLNNVTFSGNPAGIGGGGMYNTNSHPTLTNITFTGNSATYYGGGMYNTNSHPTLTNVTFSANSAPGLGGGGMANDSSTPTLTNAIIWGNTPDQFFNNDSTPIITFSDIQGSYAGAGNIDADPLLGPLTDNGGFTQTHALGYGSLAIDAGDPNNCPTTDQRGYPRPIDGDGNGSAVCDMGAYEYYYSVYLPIITK